MTPDALDVFFGGFLTLESCTLGRLVTDVRNPGDDFRPVTDKAKPKHKVEIRPFESLHDAKSVSASVGLRAKLSKLFTGDVAFEGSSSDELQTQELVRYHLLQQQDYFEALCAGEDIRKWIETTTLQWPLFLVVGLITVKDAEAQAERHRAGQVAVAAEAPATEALGIPDPGGVANAGMSVQVDGSSGRSISFTAPGERVIGVRYRKLKFEMFSKKSVDTASLKKSSIWEMFSVGDRAGEDNIIEAGLEDHLVEENLECSETDSMLVLEADD
ncbi:hypothetical protein B0H67DRAFT_686198 [Lasiosphaeris hirsuta]|uniref:Uncharacterized protein n=1 Tax=Lasiosphaeris hirsuta TaxID=260670 RepID=A0AA40DQ76_9PEZI|nr:hypothetical protein B0H67DRAFT_686198 [Lasiosphaeris hirsuta]